MQADIVADSNGTEVYVNTIHEDNSVCNFVFSMSHGNCVFYLFRIIMFIWVCCQLLPFFPQDEIFGLYWTKYSLYVFL